MTISIVQLVIMIVSTVLLTMGLLSIGYTVGYRAGARELDSKKEESK